MRYYHYFATQYGEKYAMKKYSSLLGHAANICVDCEGHCQNYCPYGVPIHSLLNFAHSDLILA